MRGGSVFFLEEWMITLSGQVVNDVGFAAAFCTTAAFVPQLVRVIRLRSARDVSLGTFVLFSVGVFLWLVYGIYAGSKPVIASNFVTLGLSLSILALKIRYDRKGSEEEMEL
jgi:MtN3 and saliva related transmembrane protein